MGKKPPLSPFCLPKISRSQDHPVLPGNFPTGCSKVLFGYFPVITGSPTISLSPTAFFGLGMLLNNQPIPLEPADHACSFMQRDHSASSLRPANDLKIYMRGLGGSVG